MGIDTVYIPYKKGFEDVAIRMNASELPLFFSALSEYNFDEITVWSANERWEQHLFLKSARQKNIVETENDLYLCYNYSEKRVECYTISAVDKAPKIWYNKEQETRKEGKEDGTLKLSDELGMKKAAAQLGLPYYTLADWRNNRKHAEPEPELSEVELKIRNRELERENAELRVANEILKDALGFFAKDRKK